MSLPVYKVSDVAAMTGFSELAIRRAITQNYEGRRPGKDCRELPPLQAKRGRRHQYLILAPYLDQWLELLEDA